MGIFRKAPKAPSIPDGQRVYAIGDIHGRLDLLDALLNTIRADDASRRTAATTVIQLGDLIDRGAESANVVRRVMKGLDWATLVILRGNHEAALLDTIEGDLRMMAVWLRHGGLASLESWNFDLSLLDDNDPERVAAAIKAAVPLDQRWWMARLPLSYQVGGYYFVHAGIRPGVALRNQDPMDQLWIREDFLDSARDHGVMVVHGHTVVDAVKVLPNRLGLDTGAYATGTLSAVGLQGEERWFLST